MQSFGLPSPAQPDYEAFQQSVDANGSKVAGVVNSIAGNLVQQNAINQRLVDKTYKRMQNSVNGQLRRNRTLIQGVADSLMSPVNQQITLNQARIAGSMMNPQIADVARVTPVPPSYVIPALSGGSTINTTQQSCPPGWRPAGPGKCTNCPPGAEGICPPVTLREAWAQYDLQQTSIGPMGGGGGSIYGTNEVPPGPPAPPSGSGGNPPYTSPPQPTPPVTLPAGGGGPIYTQGGGSVAPTGGTPIGTSGGIPLQTTGGGGVTQITRGAGCIGPYPVGSQPPVRFRPGWQWVTVGNQSWYCPPGVHPLAPPPAPPPSPGGGGTVATQCPQTYTIVQGPPCPQFLAVMGTVASWAASGYQLPTGWSPLQTVTDTAANVQSMIDNMIQACVVNTLPASPPQAAAAG